MAEGSTGIDLHGLKDFIVEASQEVQTKLDQMHGTEIQIDQMFDMQLSMNALTQISEMSTSVASGMNSSVASMARNIK